MWIHDVLAQLAPDGPHIVGYSFGGATATVYAREYPEDVRSLAVLEPVFTFS
ncbi:pimeloyl-ACP methyl ester carboxylesterase [Corynebacterium durum]|uniref:alpha/beta fold hydrolase n=1 Tax=Corynebacterium durum TaxID=61592 RepID=UPI00182B4F1A|nr:alpha/beta fold hydrolase [Corynebacterium durum]NYI73358.1 pimeloyl-ACP methyl ester carboxylesterase [Corynebacterium durum]